MCDCTVRKIDWEWEEFIEIAKECFVDLEAGGPAMTAPEPCCKCRIKELIYMVSIKGNA